jgi:pilus assembly protein Flp/PilA
VGTLRKILAKYLTAGEEGAAVVEYALLLALLAVVTVAAISLIGSSLSAIFQTVATSI